MATEIKIALKHFEGACLLETPNGYAIDNRGLIDEYKPKNKVKLREATSHFNRVVKLIKQSRYAKGGIINVGDLVHIPLFNKSGVVVKKHKNRPSFVYIVKFVDNSTAPYIREDLEKVKEMEYGGGLDATSSDKFENKLWDNIQTRSMGFKKGTTIEGKLRKKFIIWRANDDSLREIIAESDTSIGANQIIAKRENKGEFSGYSRWGFDNTQDYFFHKGQYVNYAKGGALTYNKKIDRRYKAFEKGRHKSSKFSTIKMANGETFERRNANQYGKAYGDRIYTENRRNRADKGGLKRPNEVGTTVNKGRKAKYGTTTQVKVVWEYTIGGL